MRIPSYTITDKTRENLRVLWGVTRRVQKMAQAQAKKIIVENLEKTVQSEIVSQEGIPAAQYRQALNMILADILPLEEIRIEHIVPLFRIVSHNALPTHQYDAVQEFLTWYRLQEYTTHGVILASISHYLILSESIFLESSPAMARLFAFISMTRSFFDKSIYFSLEEKIFQNPSNYEKSVEYTKQNDDWTPAVNFFTTVILSSVQNTLERFGQEVQMRSIHRDILAFVQKEEITPFRAIDLRPLIKKDMRSIRRYLKEMTDLRLIQKQGDKKGSHYLVL